MSKVRIKFYKQFEAEGRVHPIGINEYETENESIGFVNRWIRRGCEVVDEKAVEEKIVEEKPAEDKPLKKITKKTTKKSTKKKEDE